MTIQTIVFESAWLTPSGLVSYQLDGSEEDGCADADDLDPSRHRPGCFRERLLRRSDPFVEALHVNRLARSCNMGRASVPGALPGSLLAEILADGADHEGAVTDEPPLERLGQGRQGVGIAVDHEQNRVSHRHLRSPLSGG